MPEQTQPIVFLKGMQVMLRPLLKEDIPLLLKWINDPEVRQYLASYLPMMEADEEEWLEKLHTRKPMDIVLGIMVDGSLIGTIGLHTIDWRHRTATTGTLIGEKTCWGKGYGTEAKMLLLHYAFNTLNLRKICSSVLAFNERSLRYALKCGYAEEGRRREHHFRDGRYWDEILLAVFRDDWQPLWEEFAKERGI